ncbi:CagE TrbE VirB component of type IV transporter system [uncultured Desulfobacterium sp.]|uniref:CagE TrbE VirB component of type IV transporter system n=1 Tax=uncultured Desulfobacterium sp. TaxID=201089 RepID=A0A445MST3_9BACT|nr:CagE TrbE VirB component of type IV transporter system [uncultured Desulfobacterium sp.]
MFRLKEYREPTHRLPDYLPWAGIIAPGVVLQKEAILQKTINFRGPDLGSASRSELVSGIARLNNALKRLESGWAIFSEAQRFTDNNYPASVWPSLAAWLVDTERKHQFKEDGSHFESNYFITFCWKLPSEKQNKALNIFYNDPNSQEEREKLNDNNTKDLAFFVKKVREISDIMMGVFPHVKELDDDETLTYLHSTISMNRHPVKMPETPFYLDALLPDQAFTPGDIPMLGDYFIPTCTISASPAESFPGILDQLNHTQIEYRWVTRYIALSKADAKAEIEKFRKIWWSKRKSLMTLIKEEATREHSALLDTEAGEKAADADAALVAIGEDLVGFGYMTTTVTTWHKDPEEALRRIQKIKQIIQSNGFTVKEEGLNGQDAWLGSLPGHVWGNVRRPMVNTLNLAHTMPVSAIWAGDFKNEHLEKVCGCGTPHITCSTTGQTPFRLNLNVGDVGHTLIVGPTGAGKSVFLCMLELQWLKYPGARVVIFDKDRSARATTLCVSGNIYEPGNDERPTAFQPFSQIHIESERIWATQYVETIVAIQGLKVTPEIKKEIDASLKNLANAAIGERTFTLFCDLLQLQHIREALRPYTLDGNYGQVFDASKDDLRSGTWQMFEMNDVMSRGPGAIIPTLDYLFHRVEQMMGPGPMLLVLDEAWLFLTHPVFMEKLKNWLKTLRKKNVYVVFATQEVADAAESPIMPTILSACHTKIYLPDEEALTPAMLEAYRAFGLTETEVTLLSNAQKKKDYYYRSVKGRRLFSLNMGDIALAFCAMSSPADHLFLDELERNFKPEEYPIQILKHRRLDWAADLYEKTLSEIPKGLSRLNLKS